MRQAIIVAGHKGGDETIQEVLWGSLRIKVSKDKKSAVLRVRRLAGKRLTFVLEAEDETLREFAEESSTGRAAKTLVKQGPPADYIGGSEKRFCASPASRRRPD